MTLQIQKKKAAGKGKKPSVRSSKVATFFDFFSPPVVPDSEDELTEEQMADLQEGLERDYELGYAHAFSAMLLCIICRCTLFSSCMW